MTIQRAIEHALARRVAKPDALARLREHNEQVADWRGQCQKCGNVRFGSLRDLRQPCASCGHGAPNASP